jgi:P-type Ca2+ transporter type 2C
LHVFENEQGQRIIASKGAQEALLKVCHLTPAEQKQIEQAIQTITGKGYRVLAVGQSNLKAPITPQHSKSYRFRLKA